MSTVLQKTLIVMPAFNEAGSVGDVVREVYDALPGVTVLVVDDGSADATSRIAREAGALVATLPFNLGVGGAMQVGFLYARSQGFDNVVQVDSDGQHDPASVPSLLEALEHADLVLGARFAGQGNYSARGLRRLAMVVLASILSRIARTKLTDVTSGNKASGPKAVALFAEHYPAEYLGDTIESLVIAARSGLVVRQVPVSMRERVAGVPSHNFLKSTAYLGRAGIALVFALVRPRSSYAISAR
jgi:glycosyltransferase involved in cell wall biosynthesis